MVEVRRLGLGDLGPFRAMNAVLRTAFEDEESYAAAPPSEAYVQRLLSDPTFIALLAVDGDEAVGALAAYELRKFERERSELYIYDLAVLESHRREGVATALITWLQSYASTINAWVVYVQADPPDEPAVALYDKLGTREEVYHFDLPIVPARS